METGSSPDRQPEENTRQEGVRSVGRRILAWLSRKNRPANTVPRAAIDDAANVRDMNVGSADSTLHHDAKFRPVGERDGVYIDSGNHPAQPSAAEDRPADARTEWDKASGAEGPNPYLQQGDNPDNRN